MADWAAGAAHHHVCSWSWVIFANVLLGVNQGFCWSTSVIMKIDLVGPKQRGLAMGLNEFAGYLAVSLSALGTGFLAATYGFRPISFVPRLPSSSYSPEPAAAAATT